MTDLSLKAKQAYFARVRRANYAASLRLEGINGNCRPASCKADIIAKYRRRDD